MKIKYFAWIKDITNLEEEEINSNRIKNLGLENDLIKHEGLTPGMLVTLGEKKILTLYLQMVALTYCIKDI